MPTEAQLLKIGKATWEALSDRRGFRQTMDGVDKDIQHEIFMDLGQRAWDAVNAAIEKSK